MLNRIKVRVGLAENNVEKDKLIAELIETVKLRISLRVGLKQFPDDLESLAVDVAVIYYNRIGAEGSDTEKLDVISTTYIRSILDEFNREIQEYKDGLSDSIESINARRSNKARLL